MAYQDDFGHSSNLNPMWIKKLINPSIDGRLLFLAIVIQLYLTQFAVVSGSTVQLKVNHVTNLLPGSTINTVTSNSNQTSVNYATSWLTSDHTRCTIKLETDYSQLDGVNHSISELIVWFQVKGSPRFQLWIDFSEKSLFSREYSIDLPFIRKDQFRLLIDFQSVQPFNLSSSIIKRLETDRCWHTYQVCPVLSCLTYGANKKASCSFTPSLSFNCSTAGLCIHQDEVCDYETNCPDASDEVNCDQVTSGATSKDNNSTSIAVQLNGNFNGATINSNNLRCSFESDYCSWEPIKSSSEFCFWGTCSHDRGLNRTIAASSLTQGPTFDHTKGNASGHYLLLKSTSKRGRSTGSIASKTLICGHCKLVFHYLTNSRSGQVLIRSSDNSSSSFNPFSTIEVIDLDWEKSLFTRVEVEVDPGLSGEWLFLVAMIKGDENSFLAIDDIYFTKGCYPHPISTSSPPPSTSSSLTTTTTYNITTTASPLSSSSTSP